MAGSGSARKAASAAGQKSPAAVALSGKRMAPEEREQQIVEKAVRYFATHGFSGSTRDLAKEIGITQPLLYRYFPNKEALVDRVFQEVYMARWNPDWEDWLKDRSMPLRQRLIRYYVDYARFILRSEWIRIFVFAGLTREGINQRYLARLRERIFDVVLAELHHEHQLATPTRQQYEDEIELVWGVHASIFYVGMRKWIYGLPVPKDLERMIEHKVCAFLDGAPAVMRMMRAESA